MITLLSECRPGRQGDDGGFKKLDNAGRKSKKLDGAIHLPVSGALCPLLRHCPLLRTGGCLSGRTTGAGEEDSIYWIQGELSNFLNGDRLGHVNVK